MCCSNFSRLFLAVLSSKSWMKDRAVGQSDKVFVCYTPLLCFIYGNTNVDIKVSVYDAFLE